MKHRSWQLTVLALFVVACSAAGLALAQSQGRSYYVDAARGRDSGPGTESTPWRTIGRANEVRPGSTVRVAAGTYADAPQAPGVRFIGATERGSRERIVSAPVKLNGRGTRITGFTLAGGLDFEAGARDNVIESGEIRHHWSVSGGPRVAPRNNTIRRARMNVREIWAHRYGDDLDPTPRISGLRLENCQITVRRSGGVLWRWSGVDDARILGTTIRLVNGGNKAGEDASWWWTYVRRAVISDSRIVLDHAADFSETGPFAPIWRDSTWGARVVRTTIEAVRGGMIFSPNTAGTWICSCGGHRWEDVTIRAPGTVWFYQCPRKPNDVWVRSKMYVGRLDEYNVKRMPEGLSVRPHSARSR